MHKHFDKVHAVRGLNLTVPRGQVFGLPGLDWRAHGKEIRNRIGVQFQSTPLDEKIKVREVLEVYSQYYDKPRPINNLLASFASSVEVANGLANLVFLPLMMLSGVYFSLDAAPTWLQKASDLTPLTPLLKALRAIFNDGAELAAQGQSILIIAAWSIVLFLFAVRRFKWV